MIDPDAFEHTPLRCQVLKTPHHMSKHGISLEVLETMKPRHVLTSCSNRSKHGFPHDLTVMAVKDVRQKQKNAMRFTGHPSADNRAGTIVTIFRENTYRSLLYGLGEPATESAPLPNLD